MHVVLLVRDDSEFHNNGAPSETLRTARFDPLVANILEKQGHSLKYRSTYTYQGNGANARRKSQLDYIAFSDVLRTYSQTFNDERLQERAGLRGEKNRQPLPRGCLRRLLRARRGAPEFFPILLHHWL